MFRILRISSKIKFEDQLRKQFICTKTSSLFDQNKSRILDDHIFLPITSYEYFVNVLDLSTKNNLDFSYWKKEQTFQKNLDLIITKLKNKDLGININEKIFLLNFLQFLKVPEQEAIYKILINKFFESQNLNLKHALKVLLFQVSYQESPLQKKFLADLIDFISENIFQIKSIKDVILIYNPLFKNIFKKEFYQTINKSIYKLILLEKNHEPTDLSFLLNRIILSHQQPINLIKAIITKLQENEGYKNLNVGQIITVISNLGTVNLMQKIFLEQLTDELVNKNFLQKTTNNDIIWLFKTLAHLRYNNEKFFKYLDEEIFKEVDLKILIQYVILASCLNYKSPNLKQLLINKDNINKNLNSIKDSINFYWALAYQQILNEVPDKLYFCDQSDLILDELNQNFHLKRRYILLYHYCRSNLNKNLTLSEKIINLVHIRKNVNNNFSQDFVELVGTNNVIMDVNSDLAISFDFVFVANKDLTFLPIKEFPKNLNDLITGYKLFCLCINNPKEIDSNGNFSGEIEMTKKIAKENGYFLIFLDQKKYCLNADKLTKLKFLEKLILASIDS